MTYPAFNSGDILTATDMNAVGLWKVKPASVSAGSSISATGDVTFTTQSSVSINNCFSANYSHYLITASIRGSAASFARWRLRASGSDATGANYFRAGLSTSYGSGSLTPYNAGSETSWVPFSEYGTTSNGFGYSQIMVFNPFVAATTGANTTINNTDAASIYTQALTHGLQTSYDGFSVLPNSGTITGTIRVYGYNG